MNPNDPCVQSIARTLVFELGSEAMVRAIDEEPLPSEAVRTAMAIVFGLAKSGIRVVEPDDVIEQERDEEAHTVKLVLAAEE